VRLALNFSAVFSHTETCDVLSPVKGSRAQPLQRSRNAMPAIRVIRSSVKAGSNISEESVSYLAAIRSSK